MNLMHILNKKYAPLTLSGGLQQRLAAGKRKALRETVYRHLKKLNQGKVLCPKCNSAVELDDAALTSLDEPRKADSSDLARYVILHRHCV